MASISPVSWNISSLCPFPSTPATPRISPSWISKLISFSTGFPALFFAVRCRTESNTFSPTGFSLRLAVSRTGRPTIMFASTCGVAFSSLSSVPTTLPRRITVIRSAHSLTSSSLCVMITMVFPIARSSFSRPTSSSISCGTRTAVGSSRMSTSAFR